MKKQIAVGLLVLLSLTSGNAQNLIQNGSFELPGLTGNVGSDQQERFDAYSTNITGWIVGGVGNVYLHKYPAGPAGGFGPAEDGSFYVDLSGAGTPHATVYQDFATSPGTNYVLTFYVGSSGGTSPIINIELQGAVVLLNTNVAPVAPNANGINWLKETFVFVADTNTTRLSLVDTSSSDDNSSFVDNVSVIPILPPMYQVIDLSPTLQPNNVANSYGISDDGQVTGIITTSYGQDAFLFTNGIMQDLGTLSGANGSAYAKGVNTNGQVVGYSLWRGYGRAFFYSDGVMQNAGTLGGDTSVLTAINNNGVATGYAQTGLSSNPWHAVLYSNGVMQDIGNLGYDYNYESRAYAINNSNQIVGNAIVPPSNNSHAFLYQNGLMQDLGSLPGCEESWAYGINNNNQIVGSAGPTNGQYHAFIYSNGQMQDLGTLGGSYSQAYAINDSGQIIGNSQISEITGEAGPFLYSSGLMWNLNNLITTNSGWTLTLAKGINNTGQIVVQGQNTLGQIHALLLNPISPFIPKIVCQSDSRTTGIGSTINLNVRATNSPMSYQWYFGTNVIVGATNRVLQLTNLQQSQSGAYTVAVSNPYGLVTSNPIMLDVLPTLGINMVPAISITGTIGATYQLNYVNAFGPINAWQTLATIAVTNSLQYYFDLSAIGQPQRFYQLLQVQ